MNGVAPVGRVVSWFGIGLLTISTFWACGRTPEADTSAGRDMDPTHPLSSWCEGRSLDAARDDAPFEIVLPETNVASARTTFDVWECPSGEYYVEFGTGVTIRYGFNGIDDPEREWRGLAREYAEFSVGEVNGVPASLADPAVDGAIGGVDWVVGGVRYTVSGNGAIPLDDLLAVARSMPIPAL